MSLSTFSRGKAILVSAVIAAFSLGVYADRHFRATPAVKTQNPDIKEVPHAKAAKDSYQFFDTLVDVRAAIKLNYVEPVDDQKLLIGAINGMMAELDPYSNYFTSEDLERFDRQIHGTFSGIGAEMSQDAVTRQFIIVSTLEDSPALKAGIQAGDRIMKINGETMENKKLSDLIMSLQGPPDSEITITVIHEGEKTPVDIKIRRSTVTFHSIKGYKRDAAGTGWDYMISPEHRIAYVRITNFMESTAEDMDKALLPLFKEPDGLRGIILDLRFNPGGLLTAGIDVSDRFLESGTIVSTRKPSGADETRAVAKKEGTYPNVPVVVLINEYSASASEIVAGALKDNNRALLIGMRSFGKGSVQNLITLDNGNSAMKLTTHYYYLPSGRNIAKRKDSTTWGVEPEPIFQIPLTDAENRAILQARAKSEVIRVKLPTPDKAPATQAATQPGEEIDRQLTRALETLVAAQVFKQEKPISPVQTTRPEATVEVGTQPDNPPETMPAKTPESKPAMKEKLMSKPAEKKNAESKPADE